jgi:hypothetical protein
MKSNTYTLAALKLRRAELMKQIEEKEQSIRSKTDALLATPVPGNKAELIVNRAMAAYTAYDGFMTGYKLLKSIGMLFKKTRKKK